MNRPLHPKERRARLRTTGEEVVVYKHRDNPTEWVDSRDCNTSYDMSELDFNVPQA